MAATASDWLDELGGISDDPTGLTRTFLSPASARARALVAGWMRGSGLETYEDGAGNLVGRLASRNPSAGTVVCGSHLDTVRDAGRFDGALGVIAAIRALDRIRASGGELPFHVQVAGFSDEEGVRFQTTYLGSRYFLGLLTPGELSARDRDGISVGEAIGAFAPALPPPPGFGEGGLLGYIETHIEQGPVLETDGLALGVATSIAGQKRLLITLEGRAGHAGTTPMELRRDALAGAAEAISTIETLAREAGGIVATVGELRIPGAASNVIPGRVEFTLDARGAEDGALGAFYDRLEKKLLASADARGLRFTALPVQESCATPCSPRLTGLLESAVRKHQPAGCPALSSGAGHDAISFAPLTEIGLLFVRCRDGLSHHPEEYASPGDIDLAIAVLADALLGFAGL